MTNLDSASPLPEEEPVAKGSPAKKVAVVVLALLVGSLWWQVVSDHSAPSTTTGAVLTNNLQVSSRVSGQIEEVYVKDNQLVQAGEPLFALDPLPFELAVQQAEVSLTQARADFIGGEQDLKAAEAQLRQAAANLEASRVELARSEQLRTGGMRSVAEHEKIAVAHAGAQAALDAATAQVEGLRIRVGSSEETNSKIQAALVSLEQAKLNWAFAIVKAPTDGFITNLKLVAGQMVGAGSPALTLVESGGHWISVELRENQLVNLDVGDSATVTFDVVPGRTFNAKVTGIAHGIDNGRSTANGLMQNQSATRWFEPARKIPVTLQLDDAEEWPTRARLGSKVSSVIYAENDSGPVAWVSYGFQVIKSYLSYLN